MQQDLPTFSVVVPTYNSEETILDTLDSIKFQTYPNIELIITDDASYDNTIFFINQWILKNQDRFKRVIVIQADKNVGIVKNINKGYKKSMGIWVKPLAGDDMLIASALYDFYKFIEKNPDANIIFAKVKAFYIKPDIYKYNFPEYPAYDESQYLKKHPNFLLTAVVREDRIPAPGVFIKLKALQINDFCNERYQLADDTSLYCEILIKQGGGYFYDNFVAHYRLGTGVSTKVIGHTLINDKKILLKNIVLKNIFQIGIITSFRLFLMAYVLLKRYNRGHFLTNLYFRIEYNSRRIKKWLNF